MKKAKAKHNRPRGGPVAAPPTLEPLLPGKWPVNLLIFLLLLLATCALYVGDLHIGFFSLDDATYVPANPWIREISMTNIWRILAAPYFVNYSPVHLFSYMLDYAFAGAKPVVFHLSSNIWAGVTAGFVFLLGLALTRQHTVAIAAGALFVIHPAHVEAIAWISSRKDLVAAAFAVPSFLAYLGYRHGGARRTWWYSASLILFTLAAGGKMSVATLPVVLLAYDYFIEQRPLSKSLIDKVPFFLVALVIAAAVASAQPQTGIKLSASVVAAAFGQSLWLLTGFGDYVLYRITPGNSGIWLQIGGIVLLLALFVAPTLLLRKWPLAALLAYWILFGLIPAQVLSFLRPVTDRYLFLPSVGATILIAAGIIGLGQRFGKTGLSVTLAIVTIVAGFWMRTTLACLADWRDVRSIWYSAAQKTADPDALFYLGLRYQELADGLGTTPRGTPVTDEDARRVAEAVWANDPRLPAVLEEWSRGKRGGPIEQQFRSELRSLAWDAYEQRLKAGHSYAIPDLFFHRGVILADNGDLPGARKEFLAAAQEASDASQTIYPELRQKSLVETHNALGLVAWKAGDQEEALRWFKMAEAEQTSFGAAWVPDLKTKIQKLEAALPSASK